MLKVSFIKNISSWTLNIQKITCKRIYLQKLKREKYSSTKRYNEDKYIFYINIKRWLAAYDSAQYYK